MTIRRFLSLLLSLVLILSLSSVAYAESLKSHTIVETTVNDTEGINADEVEWIFRKKDGKLERRLWSYTYNQWLTDWEFVCYLP